MDQGAKSRRRVAAWVGILVLELFLCLYILEMWVATK